MTITILIADDHKIFRERPPLLLSQQSDFCAELNQFARLQQAKPDHV